MGDSHIPYSFELEGDALMLMDNLQQVLIDAADRLMATAYTTGSGTGEPEGIVIGLLGTAAEINGGGSEAIAADAFTLQNALAARYSGSATWLANIAVLNTFRQFETTNSALQFPELRDNPPYLLGKRVSENSDMDGAIDAAATANNYAAIYGSIRDAFMVVDRVGSTLELVNHVLDPTTGRPTGQRGALLWFRTGSAVTNLGAAKLLDIPTAA